MVPGSDCQFMNNASNIISVIPARAGSKRIPGKNKLPFQNQSMIEWSVKFSLSSNMIDKTILSTDDEEIIGICNKYNILIHNRTKSLSKDESSTFDVLKDIYFNYLDQKADIIFLLQPTSPLREKTLINEALKLIKENENWSSLIEVFKKTSFTGKIVDGFWEASLPEKTRSQEIEPDYIPSGRLYAYNCKETLDKNNALGDKVIPMITEEWKNINIDEKEDLLKLDYILEQLATGRCPGCVHALEKNYSYLLN